MYDKLHKFDKVKNNFKNNENMAEHEFRIFKGDLLRYSSRAVLSNLVAIRHMWRQEI